MNKKGLEIVVELIIILLFLASIVLVLVNSQLLNKLIENASIFICSISSLVRGLLIKIIFIFIGLVMSYVMYLTLLNFISGVGAAKETATYATPGYEQMVAKYLITHEAAPKAAAIGGIGGIITFYIISSVIAQIPLMCTAIDTNMGDVNHFVGVIPLSESLGSHIQSTWDMMGDGEKDPLYGITPNPRIFFVIKVYAIETTNMSELYKHMSEKYHSSLFKQQPGFYLYCNEGSGFEYYGRDLNRWSNCKFKKAIVYVLFFDRYDYVGYFVNAVHFTPSYKSQILTAINPDLFHSDAVIVGVEKID